ncbi:MAG: inositol monophosphatase [Gammaproteobacteria bacterium SG8_11]|nr:MAG: inositol monophosphatase [Gammaproteobacteria bacterium SG8_11]
MDSKLARLKNIVAECAGDEIIPRFQRVSAAVKQDGSIITEADFAMQNRVKSALQTLWPEIAFVGEEMSAEEQQRQFAQSQHGVWILDPLDGTSNFAAAVPFFSVSMALIQDGDVLLGLVYDPLRDEMFSAIKGHGAFLNNQELTVKPFSLPLQNSIGVIDFKRLDKDLAGKLAQQAPYASQRSFGSVALDWCWIAAGRGHVYLHGKQKLWDYAAGWLILHEAGGYSCTLEGEPVYTGQLQSRSAVAAADKNLFQEWCQWLNISL